MTKLEWDRSGSHNYESGVDRGVLYPTLGPGVAWNGLVTVKENESDATNTKTIYIDGQQLLTQVGLGSYSATIGAFTYPKEFEEYDGYDSFGFSNQVRKTFGFSYRSNLGNDRNDVNGRLIHIVYNALAEPSDKSFQSLSDVTDPNAFSWDISTLPVVIPEARQTAHFIIDTSTAAPAIVETVENWLYGTDLTNPVLPPIENFINLFDTQAIFLVTIHGDGTATISGPDESLDYVTPDIVRITSPSVKKITDILYRISSY